MNSSASSNGTENQCKNYFYPDLTLQFFPDDLYALLITGTVLDLVSCPLAVLMNAFVIVAVKTKQRLQTHPNILLACLALTDLMVGLVVQPLHITMAIFLLQGKGFGEFCEINLPFTVLHSIFSTASLSHLSVISAERYFAVKHTFAHTTFVTKTRLVLASAMAWLVAFLLFMASSYAMLLSLFLHGTVLSSIVLFQVLVYRVARRHEKQILSQNVSLEARAKFKKEKKAIKLTAIIIATLVLCYLTSVTFIIVTWHVFGQKISADFKTAVRHLALLPVFLNSIFNPIIYTVRKRQFRIAFIELLFRKSLHEAEEIEKKLFRSANNVVRPEAGQDGKEPEGA